MKLNPAAAVWTVGPLGRVLSLLSVLMLVTPASAEPVTFEFEGLVTQANAPGLSITVGQTITGTYTFESNATDLDPLPEAGRYQGASTIPIALSVAVQTPTFVATLASPNTSESIFVGDQFLGTRDQYGVSVSSSSGLFFFVGGTSLTDLAILSSDALPTVPPDISRFDSPTIQLSDGVVGGVNATLTSLTLRPPDPVPALSWQGTLLLSLTLAGLSVVFAMRFPRRA